MGGRFDGTGQAAKREVDEAGAPTWEDPCREFATGPLMSSSPQVAWWARRGPLEDSGGSPRYEEIMDALADPSHPTMPLGWPA